MVPSVPKRQPTEGPTEATVRRDWAEAIRVERARRRLTRVAIAEAAGVDTSTVWKVEDGRGSLDSFLAVARVLEIDLFAAVTS